MTLTIASRVILSHCGFESEWATKKTVVLIFGIAFLLAALSRVISDFVLDYYFGMLHIAAGLWLMGAIAWGWHYMPRVMPWNRSSNEGDMQRGDFIVWKNSRRP